MIKITRSKKDKQLIGIIQDLNDSGIPKGYSKLSKSPEVIGIVDRIADLISNMTIYLMENTDEGDVRVKNGLSTKIDINPLKNVVRKNWVKAIVRCMLLEGDGNAVVKPVYKDGLIEDLIVVPADDFSINLGKDFEDDYTIQIKDRKYNPDDLIHFVLNPSPHNIHEGRSYRIPLKQLTENLKAADDIEKEFMQGRFMPSVVIKFQGDVHDLESREGGIINTYLKSSNPMEPWVIPADMLDVDQIKPMSLNDIALPDLVLQNKKTIAGLLGVPAFFIGAGEYNKEEYNAFIQEKIAGIAKVIEQTLTQKLLISDNYYFKFNIRSLYNYDIKTMADVGDTLYSHGVITGNELRDWLGWSPRPELNDLIILENYIPAADIGNQKKLDNGGNNGET